VAQQFTNKEIARALNISTRAVEERLRSARLKLRAPDRRAAARIFQALPQTCEESTGGTTTVDTKPAPTQVALPADDPKHVKENKTFTEELQLTQGDPLNAPGRPDRLARLEAFDRRFGRIGRVFAILGLAALLAVLLVAGVTIAVVAQMLA
jgi:hypothetical protein